MTILIIEADELLLNMYLSFFKAQNKTVYGCVDADQAINLLDKNKIDLIIADYFFLQHNIFELLYELRSYVDWINIPLIIYTSYDVSLHHPKLNKLFKDFNILTKLNKIDWDLIKLNSFIDNLPMVLNSQANEYISN